MAMDSVFRVSLVLDMVDNMTSKVKGATTGTSDALNKLNSTFGTMQKAGAVMTGIGTAITSATLSTVTATFDTQNALAEVASLGVEDLGALEDAAKNFSDTWAGTTKSDFISAAYDIKSGIASLSDEGVAQFTEIAGMTAKATKATTAEMTSLFATGYGIYKNYYSDLSDMEFGELFSAGISTAVKNYKTSGTQMADSIKMIGATATNANVPMEEQLAILGQLQTTMSGSEAGTKYKAFLNSVNGAGEKLGLTFTDSNNVLLSTPEIMDRLKTKYGETIDAVEKQQLKEAFGTDEAVAFIDLMYKSTDQLKTGIEDMQTSMQGGIETTKGMADAINDTPEQKFEVIKQKIHNATEELGQGLLPTVNNTLDKVGDLIQRGSDWIANNQEIVSTVMNLALRLGVFLIAAGAATSLIGTLGKTITNLSTISQVASRFMQGFGGTLLASPVTWVVVGILALVAAFKLLGGDASKAGDIINRVFGSLEGILTGLVQGITDNLPQFLAFGVGLIATIIMGITSAAPGLLQTVASAVLNLLGVVVQILPSLINAGAQLVIMLIQGVATMVPRLIQTGISFILSLLQGILSAAPRLLAAVLTIIPAILQAVVGAAPSLIGGGFQIITSILSGILSAIPSIISTLFQMFGMVFQTVLSIDWIGLGLELIKGIASGILEGFGGLLDTVGGLFGNLKDFLTGKSGAGDAVGEMTNSIQTQTPALQSAVNGVSDTLSNMNPDTSGAGSIGQDLMNNVTNGITSGTGTATAAAQQAGNDISSAFTVDTSGAGNVGTDLMNNVTNGITSGTGTATAAAQQAGNDISSAFTVDTSGAGNVGTDLMNNVTNGITSGTGTATAAAQQAGSDISSAFTVDTSGAGNVGADLMGNVTSGIASGTATATAAASQAGSSISSAVSTDTAGAQTAGTGLMNSVASGITSGTPTATSAMQAGAQAIMNGFRSATSNAAQLGNSLMQQVASGIRSGGAAAVSAAQGIASRVRSAFSNMHIRVPAPSLPHVNVSYSTVGSGGASAKVPRFSVSYHASGGIMTRPTLFAMNGSEGMVGGEAGPEAILPLSTLWDRMRTVVSNVVQQTVVNDPERKPRKNVLQEKSTETVRTSVDRSRTEYAGTDRKQAEQPKRSTVINKVEINVDMDSIDSITKLKKLLDELEGYDDPDYATA